MSTTRGPLVSITACFLTTLVLLGFELALVADPGQRRAQ